MRKVKSTSKMFFNFYRTKFFIVKQDVSVQTSPVQDNFLLSKDTFFRRTKLRDKKYEKRFLDKLNINGKRIRVSASLRKYIY